MRKYYSGIVLFASLLIYGILAKQFDEECLGGLVVLAGCGVYFVLLSRYRSSLAFDIIRESEHEFVVRGSEGKFVFNRQRGTVSRLNHLVATFQRIRRIRVTRNYDEGYLLSFEYCVHLVLESSEITVGTIWKEADAWRFANRLGDWLGREVEICW